jgi:hypothetical protein
MLGSWMNRRRWPSENHDDGVFMVIIPSKIRRASSLDSGVVLAAAGIAFMIALAAERSDSSVECTTSRAMISPYKNNERTEQMGKGVGSTDMW